MFLGSNGLTAYVTDLIGRYHYMAPFTILLLCGLGFPLPEEVALVGSGILLHQGEVEFVPITLVCSAAILLGDSIPFWIGRNWGLAALKKPIIAKVLHPERFAKLERRFAAHGNWVVFSCRFMPGLRIPAYFVAGTLRMGFARFLLLDLAGVAISVPVSIWLGKVFGESIAQLQHKVKQLNYILAFAMFAIIVVVVWRAWWHKKEIAEDPPPEPPDMSPPDVSPPEP